MATPDTFHSQLPVITTPFLGREREHAAVFAALHDPTCRLVTLTGIGGVGKTRLAVEVATALASAADATTPCPDGVVFVSLASLAPAQAALTEQLATTIATAIGLPIAGPDTALVQVGHFLREKALLLVLDNFEDVLAGVEALPYLLGVAPRIKLLVTSREHVRLRGERVIVLHGLGIPEHSDQTAETSDAVRFFLALTRLYAPDLPEATRDLPSVVRICRALGGLPLGIELAASWTRTLSYAEIADELAQSFDFLADSIADLPTRQHSLRAVFHSSWRMLTEQEQRALRQLAALPDSFTREAAAYVAGVSLPLLASLMGKSVVRRAAQIMDRSSRFALPEPLRPYIVEALAEAGEAGAAADRQSSYFLALLAARTPDLRGPDQLVALRELSLETSQLRAAWQHAVAHHAVERIDQAINGMFQLYDMRSWFSEGAEAFGAARAALEQDANTSVAVQVVWARLLAREAWFVFQCGRQALAKTQLGTSLATLQISHAPARDVMWALNYLAAICSYLGEYATTTTLCTESLALADTGEWPHERVVALSVMCQSAYDQGDFAAARRYGEQSLVLEQRIGSPWSIAFSLLNLGKVVAAQGDMTQAHSLFERSLHIRRELGDIRGTAICLNRLGDVALALNDQPGAVGHYAAALEQFRAIGNPWGIAAALLQLGQVATHQAGYPAAARLLHEALELALDTGAVPQNMAIISAFYDLLRRMSETQRIAVPADLPDIAALGPDQRHAVAARLLAWSAGSAPAALTTAEAIQATRAAAEHPQRLSAAPATVPPAGLTTREIDVLRLVAQGMTDAQVADQLVLSPRTVQSHLASIYGKLGVNSRSAATRFALEHRLA